MKGREKEEKGRDVNYGLGSKLVHIVKILLILVFEIIVLPFCMIVFHFFFGRFF